MEIMRRVLFAGKWNTIAGRMVFAAAFSIAVVFSGKITLTGNTYATFEEAVFHPFSLRDLFAFLLSFCIVYCICSAVCHIVLQYQSAHRLSPRQGRILFFLLVFVIMIIVWLPCLLTFYPGGVYSDTAASIWMAEGKYPLSNHHPILYTMFWKLILAIGGVFSLSYEGTFFLFTCCTAVCMALAAAYLIYSCYLHGVPGIIIILMTAFYALYTLVPLYVVSLWKDTPFSIAVLAFSTSLMNIFWDSKSVSEIFEKKNLIPFLVFGVLTSFLRNNGIYVFVLVAAAVFLYYAWKKRTYVRKLGVLLLAVLAAVFVIRVPLFNRMGWNVKENVESLGIPLQQVGYILNATDSMTDRQTKFLNEILPVEKWKKDYCPLIVDSVKLDEEFDLGFFNIHVKDFFQVYLELVTEHPAEAVKAYALATVGFWDPAKQTGTAYICNYMWHGLSWEMKDIPEEWFGKSLKNLYGARVKLSSALYGWVILFCITVGMCTRKARRILIPVLPVLGIWLTLLAAAPVAFSLRYFFPAVLAVPMAFVLMICPGMDADIIKQ